MATVLNMHARQLYNGVEWVRKAPQIHVHFLTHPKADDAAFKAEICCHGCGAAILLTYSKGDTATLASQKDRFVIRHGRCPNRIYEKRCIDIRTSFEILDVRHKSKPDPPKEVIR